MVREGVEKIGVGPLAIWVIDKVRFRRPGTGGAVEATFRACDRKLRKLANEVKRDAKLKCGRKD